MMLRPSCEHVLHVQRLRKVFGSKTAVADFSITVAPGEVVGLLGPNGAGKTTTISCISGLLTPEAGRISICGVDALAKPRLARRASSTVVQELAIYPGLDVDTNLHFYCALAGFSKLELKRVVGETVERLALGSLLHERVQTLSVGQQRLVHVATAFLSLASRPGLLILDEATAALDVVARNLVLDAVRSYAKAGVGVLYSSHYLTEVEELCGRVSILHRGEVIAEGAVPDLIRRHGGGHIEIELDEGTVIRRGDDIQEALSSLQPGVQVRGIRLVRPSLEAVFLALTGESMSVAEGGEGRAI
jgi:ABC-2 type transport system ATP-binding protein